MKYEIWLSNDYTHFGHGIAHMDDGRKLELCAWQHTATYGRDSLLIDDEERFKIGGLYPLRWFIMPGSLEFYSVDKDTPDVLFHNESGVDLRIDDFGVLPNGASMEVQPHKTGTA